MARGPGSASLRWPAIDPGKLIHQIQLLAPSTLADAFGQAQQAWNPVLQTWADIQPVRGIDIIRSGQETKQLFLTVTIPWQAGVATDMRVQSANGTYIVQSVVNPGERNVLLELTCLAIDPTDQ